MYYIKKKKLRKKRIIIIKISVDEYYNKKSCNK